MKYQYTSLLGVSLSLPVQGWLPLSLANSKSRFLQKMIPRVQLALQSTLVTKAEEETASQIPEQAEERSTSSFLDLQQPVLGQVIAEGTIVAQFPGGFRAVRLKDDFLVDTVNTQPQMMSPPVPSETKSVSVPMSNGDLQGKLVRFSDSTSGVVVAHRPPLVFVYSLYTPSVSTADSDGLASVVNTSATISVSLPNNDSDGDMVMNFFGNAPNSMNEKKERAIFSPIPQLKDIALINHPVLTGITMFDALAPIGRGQNMLLIGHDNTAMRGYTMDFLQTQVQKNSVSDNRLVKLVYAVSDVDHCDQVLAMIRERNLEKNVHVVVPNVATNDTNADIHDVSKASQAIAIASAACALGELFALEEDAHAIVIVDTIDLYKKLWDATTRVLVDVFGVDAVVKGDRDGGASSEMRAFYSSLIQRSAQFKTQRGGGSVTLLLLTSVPRLDMETNTVFSESDFDEYGERVKLRVNLLVQRKVPLTAANLRKIDIPIPTSSEGKRRFVLQHLDELISMSDGQIWLDERLEATGQQPPMDPQRSLTRIGIGADTNSRADAPAFRRITDRLRLEISQAADLEGAEMTEASKRQYLRKNALLLAMHQNPGTGGRRLSESCAVLLAASQGFLDESVENGTLAGTHKGELLISSLLDHVSKTAVRTMAFIDETFDFGDNERNELTDALKQFFHAH